MLEKKESETIYCTEPVSLSSNRYREGRYRCGGRLNDLAGAICAWREGKQFDTNWRNAAEKLLLIVSEIGEATEAWRKLPKDFLVQARSYDSEYNKELADSHDVKLAYLNFGEEIADILIRTIDLAYALGYDIEREIAAKMYANEQRPIRHGKYR